MNTPRKDYTKDAVTDEVLQRWFFESSLDAGRAYTSEIVHALCTDLLKLRNPAFQVWTVRKDIDYPEDLNVHIVRPEDYNPDVLRRSA